MTEERPTIQQKTTPMDPDAVINTTTCCKEGRSSDSRERKMTPTTTTTTTMQTGRMGRMPGNGKNMLGTTMGTRGSSNHGDNGQRNMVTTTRDHDTPKMGGQRAPTTGEKG